ncbi:MAG: TlpA disulfide reductase family protein [Opitutaceae bacterium]
MKPLPYVWIAAGILFVGATVWINYEVKVNLQAASQGGATRELGEIRVGQQAPYFSTQDPAGQTVSLADFRGHKVVVLDFWASWCPPCKMAMPGLQRVQDDFRGRDLEILSINQDESAATATDFMRKKGYSLHVLLDPGSEIGNRYAARSIPTLVVVDKRGLVQWIRVGYRPDDSDLRRVLERLVKE